MISVANPPAIDLAITGGELLLRGRFGHWTAIGLAETGAESGQLRILFDVTATDRPAGDQPPLFTFTAKRVKSIEPLRYQVFGVLRAGASWRRVQAVVETPAGHTPFIAVTFLIDRSHFGDLWAHFVDELAGRHGQTITVEPFAWVRSPGLAAA